MSEQKKPDTGILIISSDQPFRSQLHDNLLLQGYKVFEAASQAEALQSLEKQHIEIVFLDIERMPAIEMDIVNYIRMRHRAEIVVLTTISEIEDATSALKNGAAFYLVKPIRFTDLKSVLDKLSVRVDRSREVVELEQRFLTDLMAGSPVMEKVLKFAMKIAPTASTVLVSGESGTGKEFFARIIHRMSQRPDGRFVPMNCGAIQDTLFESELFGHRKGSFTGADRDKAGLVEEAHLGTLFLDEVGELSPSAQVKLLRFLQEREFRRVGETASRTVDVRIIAASNKELASLVEQKKFREDLFYRLNVFNLHLPPLRERKETIPNLIRIFVHRYNEVFNKHVGTISKNAEGILAAYDYPGNVRELENILEHAVVLAETGEITERDLPDFMFRNRLLLSAPKPAAALPGSAQVYTLAEMEKDHIAHTLKVTGYNYTESSRKLGISRSTLWRKIKEYKIETR
ncbi:MAG: sigma-54-dependent Fis family transcriptional regulator [Chitinispirillaceae bacterium]|nr:sigma-54-dependent Fis family transcriptional regulator [Chitinispirillaceae bacterium]